MEHVGFIVNGWIYQYYSLTRQYSSSQLKLVPITTASTNFLAVRKNCVRSDKTFRFHESRVFKSKLDCANGFITAVFVSVIFINTIKLQGKLLLNLIQKKLLDLRWPVMPMRWLIYTVCYFFNISTRHKKHTCRKQDSSG